MKSEEILRQLQEFKETKNPFIIDKLIYDLEGENKKCFFKRKEEKMPSTMNQEIEHLYQSIPNFNTFSKKKEAIYKLLISNQLNHLDSLEGYRLNQLGQMEVMDTSRIFIIEKMETIFEENKKIPNGKQMIRSKIGVGENKLKNYMELKLDVEDIRNQFHHVTRQQTVYQLNAYPLVQVDVSYLNDEIDILGEELTCYIPKKYLDPVYFCNRKREESILCQIKTYDESGESLKEEEEVIEEMEEKEEFKWTTKYQDWTITYVDEKSFQIQERMIRRYHMLAYKKFLFEFVPLFQKGKFKGICVKKGNIEEYQLILPSDEMFRKIHGPLTLYYQVNRETKEVRMIKFGPQEVFDKGGNRELTTYKGVLVSKENREKDMFRIDLLNRIQK